jgi:hypothetical protein
MPNKPGPRKKPGERYPSGDLKPVIVLAFWGRIRRSGDKQASSELARLCFNRELTETQAEAGFLIADICRCSDSEESAKECTDAASAATRGDPHATQKDRKALDALLSEYPPKVSDAVIELCVFNRAVDWQLRPEIRKVLDDVALLRREALRQSAVSQSMSGRRTGARRTPPLDHARSSWRLGAASNETPEGTELRPDFDPDLEAFKKVIVVLQPELDADGIARLVDEFVALRDREEFRQEKQCNDSVGRQQR